MISVAHLHDGVVERDAPRRRLVDDPLLQLLVPGEGVDRQRLRLRLEELDAVLDLLHLEKTDDALAGCFVQQRYRLLHSDSARE